MTTCFFCQNLLSDYIEGILPSGRHEEIRNHIEKCSECGMIHRDLKSTIQVLHALPAKTVSHELTLQMTEAAQSGRNLFFEARPTSRWVMGSIVAVALIAAAVIIFPESIPGLSRLTDGDVESQFVRYYPLHQGAAEILEEQSAWLHSRESIMGSLWEEGGLSPEEFERTFQFKPAKDIQNQ